VGRCAIQILRHKKCTRILDGPSASGEFIEFRYLELQGVIVGLTHFWKTFQEKGFPPKMHLVGTRALLVGLPWEDWKIVTLLPN